ncbi:unnamed protein product [Lampetra fluviatilis]
MDQSGNPADDDFSEKEVPCLIVEDSQEMLTSGEAASSYQTLITHKLTALREQPVSPELVYHMAERTVHMLLHGGLRLEPSEHAPSTGNVSGVVELTMAGDDAERVDESCTQEDMFECSQTLESQAKPLSPCYTPVDSLRVLHLSGHQPLASESLSTECSEDMVAPSPNAYRSTPIIIPSSPTAHDSQDSSLEAQEHHKSQEVKTHQEETQEQENTKIHQSHNVAQAAHIQEKPSSPVAICIPPSEPEFSHDIFIPTPADVEDKNNQPEATTNPLNKSEMALKHGRGDPSKLASDTKEIQIESGPSVNLHLCSTAKEDTSEDQDSEPNEETQIDEEMEEALDFAGNNSSLLEKNTDSPLQVMESKVNEPQISCPPNKSEDALGKHGIDKETKVIAIIPALEPSHSDCVSLEPSNVKMDQPEQNKNSQTELTKSSEAVEAMQVEKVIDTNTSLSSQPKFKCLEVIDEATVKNQEPRSPLEVEVDGSSGDCEDDTGADVALHLSLSESQAESQITDSSVIVDNSVGNLSGKSIQNGNSTAPVDPLTRSLILNESGTSEKCSLKIIDNETQNTEEAVVLEKHAAESQHFQSEPITAQPKGSDQDVCSQSKAVNKDAEEMQISQNKPRLEESEGGFQGRAVEAEVRNVLEHETSQQQAAGTAKLSSSEDDADNSVVEETNKTNLSCSSSNEVQFHFTLPKEGEVIRLQANITPPLIRQMRLAPRHSTPIGGSEPPRAPSAASDVVAGDDSKRNLSQEGAQPSPSSQRSQGARGDLTSQGGVPESPLTPQIQGNQEDVTFPEMQGIQQEENRFKKIQGSEEASEQEILKICEGTEKPQVETSDSHAQDPVTLIAPSVLSPTEGQFPLPRSCQNEPIRQKEQTTEPNPLDEQEEMEVNSSAVRNEAVDPGLGKVESEKSAADNVHVGEKAASGVGLEEEAGMTEHAALFAQTSSCTSGLSETAGQTKETQTESRVGFNGKKQFLMTREDGESTSHGTEGEADTVSLHSQEEDSLPLPAPAPGRLVHRHVRTIREVKITRVITDVYYVNGKEVERRVTEEAEAPIVERQEYEQSTTSPSRTVSSLTSGDLADVSSLSTKVSNGTGSLQRTGSSTSGGGHSSVSLNRSGSGGTLADPPSTSLQRSGSDGSGGHSSGGLHKPCAAAAVGGYKSTDKGHHTSKKDMEREKDVSTNIRGSGRAVFEDNRGKLSSKNTEWEEIAGDGDAGDEDDSDPIEPEPTAEWTLVADRGPQAKNLKRATECSIIPAAARGSSDGDMQSDGSSSLVGLRVVAKWSSNEYFYSGRVVGEREAGRCRVRFDDGYECDVAGRDVLLCDPIPLHTQVTALSHDEYFSAGYIKGHRREEDELYYCVEKDGRRKWYRRVAVILSSEQGDQLRAQYSLDPLCPPTPHKRMADVSLDNLVEGKRQRRLGTAAEGRSPTTQAARQPQSPRVVPSTGKRRLQLTDQGSSDVGSPAKRGRKSTSAKHSSSGGSSPCKSIGGRSPTHSLTEERPGPQACLSSELFCGYSFVLTVSTPADRVYCRPPRFSTDESSGTEEEQAAVPYDYAAIEAQIRAAGGTVLQNLNPTLCTELSLCFLVCDFPCRSREYLLALAAGIPCVSHMWVRDTCLLNTQHDYRKYMLPSGYNLTAGSINEWHGQKNLFEDTRVLLVSEDHESFLDLWSEILMAAKAATVTCHKPTPNNDVAVAKYDLLVSDASCPPGMLHCAAALEMPVVSSEWLVQCLVTGHRVPFTSHPAFRHDHRPV